MKPFNFYGAWIAGPVFGFEVMSDDNGFASYVIHLLFVRFLITRDVIK